MTDNRHNNHVQVSDGKCSCGCDNENGHQHECSNEHENDVAHINDNETARPGKIYARADETPSVFSKTFNVKLAAASDFEELSASLETWLKELTSRLKEKKVFIGHIKAFAEIGDNIFIWMSTTGNEISMEKQGNIPGKDISSFMLGITAITFGIVHADLEETVLDTFSQKINATF